MWSNAVAADRECGAPCPPVSFAWRPHSVVAWPQLLLEEGSQEARKRHRRYSVAVGLEQEERTGRIIGAAIEVHRALGPGFLETVYESRSPGFLASFS